MRSTLAFGPWRTPDDAELVWQLRGTLVVESRRLGVASPVDGIYGRLNDEARLRAVCERALRLGYGGKLIVHPRQIAVVRSVFQASLRNCNSREVVEAYERAKLVGRGAIQVRGHVIDAPMVARAGCSRAARGKVQAGGPHR